MEVGREAADIAETLRVPITIFFYDTPELRAKLISDLEDVAKTRRKQCIFTVSQGFAVAKNVGFSQEVYPSLAVFDLVQNKPFLMRQDTPISAETVLHFLDHMEEESFVPEPAPAPAAETGPHGEEPAVDSTPGWVACLSIFFLSFSPRLI